MKAHHARTDLGELSDIAAITRITPVAGLQLVDVGCGPALTSRALVEKGAHVLGLEPEYEVDNIGDPPPLDCLGWRPCLEEVLALKRER